MNRVHKFKNMSGLPDADQYFMDARWRQMNEFIYPDHESAWDLIFKKCDDHNSQADVTGDRGEWDSDNSGKD